MKGLTVEDLRSAFERLDKNGTSLRNCPLIVPQWMIDVGINEGIVRKIDGKFYHWIYGELTTAQRLKDSE
jgi:phosphoenolpyruvate synthase/pyruvate phosphate dikinase